jgi:hypothetical protein
VRRSSVLLLLLLPLLAVGCAPAIHVPLTADLSAKIEQTRVHAVVAQDEIAALIEQSNLAVAAGGGLVFALIDAGIDSHRTARAAKLMEPVRKEVADFDFRTQFRERLQTTVAGLPPLKVAQATVVAKPLPANDTAALWKDVSENALLSLSTRYELSTSLRTLVVTTVATYWLRGRDEAIYRGRYVYYTPPLAATDREECAKVWAADKGAALRAAMREGIDQTMKMLIADVGGTTPIETATPKLSYGDGSNLHSFPAYLVKDGTRYIIRLGDGALFSASTDATFTTGTAAAR